MYFRLNVNRATRVSSHFAVYFVTDSVHNYRDLFTPPDFPRAYYLPRRDISAIAHRYTR